MNIFSLRQMCPSKEFFLVRIFPHSDWIRKDTISPYSVRMRKNTGQNKLRIWTLFIQCSLFWSPVQDFFFIYLLWPFPNKLTLHSYSCPLQFEFFLFVKSILLIVPSVSNLPDLPSALSLIKVCSSNTVFNAGQPSTSLMFL